MCCAVYESLYMVGIQMNRKWVRTCLHWRPLHVPLHSSFQQRTMGKRELLHHLAALVCFVAESWPVSLSVCFQSIFTTHTHTPPPHHPFLFHTVVTKHATVRLYYITDAFPTLCCVLFLLPFSPEGWKSQEDRLMNSCITPSYLGQWCTVLLMFCYD